MIFSEKLVIELSKSFARFAFVKVVHIELNDKQVTCLRKEAILECLKYLGRSSSAKSLSSSI